MDYNSFLDFITMEGCRWFRGFETDFGAFYQNNHTGKTCFLKEDSWVPWHAAILFCKDIGIEIPAELKHLEADFDKLGLVD